MSGRAEIVALLRQRSRPYLFSNSVPPPIAAAGIAVLDLLESRRRAARAATREHARCSARRMAAEQFDILPGEHPIVPVMYGEARRPWQAAAQDARAGRLRDPVLLPGRPAGARRGFAPRCRPRTPTEDLERAVRAPSCQARVMERRAHRQPRWRAPADVAATAPRSRAQRGRLGIDTEFMSEGRYRALLCLTQVAVDDTQTAGWRSHDPDRRPRRHRCLAARASCSTTPRSRSCCTPAARTSRSCGAPGARDAGQHLRHADRGGLRRRERPIRLRQPDRRDARPTGRQDRQLHALGRAAR